MKLKDKYRELMREQVKKYPVTCHECGETEKMNPADAHYQLIFEGRVFCSECLDKHNEVLFYGEEKK